MPIRFALAILLWALMAALDVVTGPEINFSIFYLLPVSYAAGSSPVAWAN